jgi:hypothetical protein
MVRPPIYPHAQQETVYTVNGGGKVTFRNIGVSWENIPLVIAVIVAQMEPFIPVVLKRIYPLFLVLVGKYHHPEQLQ